MTARRVRSGSAKSSVAALLAAGVAALAVLRAIAAFAPGTWTWGFNALRFSDPRIGWTLWILAAVALLPAAGRATAPFLDTIGDRLVSGAMAPRLIAAGAAAALVLVLQDRTWFLGDALLRLGAANALASSSVLAPGGAGQLLPLDAMLHYGIPHALANAHLAAPIVVSRVLGALEAAWFALATIALARALGVRGSAAACVVALAFFGGALQLFTGYDKSYTELCLVTAWIAVAALRVVREGRGLWTLGLAATAAILLHRIALAMAPVVLLAWISWLRAGGHPRWSRELPAILLPIAALAVVVPSILGTIGALDVSRHLAIAHGRASGSPGLMIQIVERIDFVLLAAPLALLIPVALPGLRQRPEARGEAMVMAALTVPSLALLVALYPQGGFYRAWDVFAACGVAIGIAGAWAVGAAVATSRGASTVAAALVLAAACPALEWLALHHDTDRGMRRVLTFATEPPTRPDPERVGTWDYLGSMTFTRGDYRSASVAFGRAVQIAPSPRLLYQLGLSLERDGRHAEAQRAFQASAFRDSVAKAASGGVRPQGQAPGPQHGVSRDSG